MCELEGYWYSSRNQSFMENDFKRDSGRETLSRIKMYMFESVSCLKNNPETCTKYLFFYFDQSNFDQP